MKKHLKKISIVLIAAAIIGFFFFTDLKGRYQVFEQRFSASTSAPVEVLLHPYKAHTAFFWAVDEEHGFEWASVEAKVALAAEDGQVLASGEINATGSEENGGIKRAQNGFDEIVPAGPLDTYLTVELVRGDYVDVEVYADLPTWLHLAPGVSILFGLVGVVLYLKNRAANAAS